MSGYVLAGMFTTGVLAGLAFVAAIFYDGLYDMWKRL